MTHSDQWSVSPMEVIGGVKLSIGEIENPIKSVTANWLLIMKEKTFIMRPEILKVIKADMLSY